MAGGVLWSYQTVLVLGSPLPGRQIWFRARAICHDAWRGRVYSPPATVDHWTRAVRACGFVLPPLTTIRPRGE